jgi:hypothetical protein
VTHRRNKYLARDSHTADNFLALHAAVNVCIAEFEAAAFQQPSGSSVQRLNLQTQWADRVPATAPTPANRTLETNAPQVRAEPASPAISTENLRQVPAATHALTPAPQFQEVERILIEMAKGNMKWSAGTRFTAPTKQLRQLKKMLGRETETTAELRPLRAYILTRLVQAIDALPTESAFIYEHKQMVVRLYQRVLHHENLRQHDHLFRLKTYRQLRVVERLDRLAATPADFRQDLLISDASIATILNSLLKFNDDGERMQFNMAINEQLRKLMRRVMSEVNVPLEQENARRLQRQSLLAQSRGKFSGLRTANLEAHAQLLALFMQGWDNWPDWSDDARNILADMVSEELRWMDENRRGYAEADPSLDFARFTEMAAEGPTSLAGQGPIAQIVVPPEYCVASSEVRLHASEPENARARTDG